MLPDDIEDWLTSEGDLVVARRARGAELSADEQLLYELWLFDTQQRNGGVSQYFCNCAESWPRLRELAVARVPSFVGLVRSIESALGSSRDPYQAIAKTGDDLDVEYERLKHAVMSELLTELRGSRPPEAG